MMLKVITLRRVEALRELAPRRRRILDHKVVRKKDDGTYVVTTKFMSLDRMFEEETKIRTNGGPFGPFVYLSDPADIDRALKWQDARRSLVFLRDCLYCSVALDFNLADAGIYSELGLAEHNAKANADEESIAYLAARCERAVSGLGLYKTCSSICAVPPSPEKAWDLPTEIAKRVAAATNRTDISNLVRFREQKRSLKSLALGDRWAALESAQLEVTRNLDCHTIIIIDDKYQSGTTMQFVGSKLLEAGASKVLGLSCVKTWRDTDNT
jgi:hypothetical protein